jgi:hypothetical protein
MKNLLDKKVSFQKDQNAFLYKELYIARIKGTEEKWM